MRISVVFLFATAIATSFAQTVAQVEADLANIFTHLNAWDTSINAFPIPGGTLAQSLTIHNNAVSLNTSYATATTDMSATPSSSFSDSDGTTILNSITTYLPTLHDALIQIVAKKPGFDALPIGGVSALIKQDLAMLRASHYVFATALIAKVPISLITQATTLRSQVDGWFVTAQAGYP